MKTISVDCEKCIHANVCKHRQMMADEIKKFNNVINQPPLSINISCDEFKEEKAIFRDQGDFIREFSREPTTGDPLDETITYTTYNTRPRTV